MKAEKKNPAKISKKMQIDRKPDPAEAELPLIQLKDCMHLCYEGMEIMGDIQVSKERNLVPFQSYLILPCCVI